ncbi:hypothetical protein SYNPS1DRAFT_27859 [Syncephalis pseudoplumigaleata]|uniref:Uncharacterized protein n=1 Tax=Syncephalis pseudoplumigaleata TaxID=1712513 RepID=A0A4P9Z1S6_9FUNG|nr:hypothetical protein SYNPS1DRAFT_27859 [Syncephalis pseudoplumigaleata]|eukprot:RKP26447.1 hypothetical protein SYNPS1DRAFT_27859 [Syncephalis pseudoplumigaleata]
MDLATGRSSKYWIHRGIFSTLLQRVTEDTATVLLTKYAEGDDYTALFWSLWQFSPSQPDSNCRCLMQGSTKHEAAVRRTLLLRDDRLSWPAEALLQQLCPVSIKRLQVVDCRGCYTDRTHKEYGYRLPPGSTCCR